MSQAPPHQRTRKRTRRSTSYHQSSKHYNGDNLNNLSPLPMASSRGSGNRNSVTSIVSKFHSVTEIIILTLTNTKVTTPISTRKLILGNTSSGSHDSRFRHRAQLVSAQLTARCRHSRQLQPSGNGIGALAIVDLSKNKSNTVPHCHNGRHDRCLPRTHTVTHGRNIPRSLFLQLIRRRSN